MPTLIVYLSPLFDNVLILSIMKYLLLITALITSCKSTDAETSVPKTNTPKVEQVDDFQQLASKNGSYILHYKVKEDKSSPVKWYTYYVTAAKSKKIVKPSEGLTAEKIYWKDDHTLAIIPYTEVMQHSDDVNVNLQPKEILIDLNK